MCRNCNRCSYYDKCCYRRCCKYSRMDNRCDDFLWPMMFWMIRDMTRHCRCNFVDRYDRFRC